MTLPDVDVYPWDREDEARADASADSCAYCDGPLQTLGTLGTRTHYRCRNCGAECSCETARIADADALATADESPF